MRREVKIHFSPGAVELVECPPGYGAAQAKKIPRSKSERDGGTVPAKARGVLREPEEVGEQLFASSSSSSSSGSSAAPCASSAAKMWSGTNGFTTSSTLRICRKEALGRGQPQSAQFHRNGSQIWCPELWGLS